jgi:hypothetical protein
MEPLNHYFDSFCSVDVQLDEMDESAALLRITDALAKRVK